MTFSHTAGRLVELIALICGAVALVVIAGVAVYNASLDRPDLRIEVQRPVPLIVIRDSNGSFRATARVRLVNAGRRPLSVIGVRIDVNSDGLRKLMPAADGAFVTTDAPRAAPVRLEEGGVFECLQSAVLRPANASSRGESDQTSLPKDMFDGTLGVYAASTAGPPTQQTYEVAFQFVAPEQAQSFWGGYYAASLPVCGGL